MMKEKALERQSTSYLIKLEHWQLLRWRRRLELLNETTDDLWLIRKVLENKDEDTGLVVNRIRDHTGTMTRAYREHLLNDSY